jgi:hypothetical protein
MGLVDLPRGVWQAINRFGVHQKRQMEALENLAGEVEKLRVLREYELGLVISESESGDIRVDELER